MSHPVRLAVTLGDPRGIGPEIVAAARADAAVAAVADLVVVGPDGTVAEVDESIGVWQPLGGDADRAALAGHFAGRAIERAVEMAQSGTVALGRGPRSMSGAGTLRPVERTA